MYVQKNIVAETLRFDIWEKGLHPHLQNKKTFHSRDLPQLIPDQCSWLSRFLQW